jgi:hypothetical protein
VTSIRRFGALVIPLAVGVVAFGPGAAAQAAGTGITSPGSNAVITSGSTATVRAHIDLLASGNLYVRGPGTGGDRKLGGGLGPKDVAGSVNISRNGAYVATLKGLLGGTVDQRTFYVRVPPARPSGVDASISEHKMVVRWDRGHEPDLKGYDVFAAGSRQRQGSVGALCAGDVCSTALSLPASGGRVEVAVRALRSNGSGGTVTSGLSKTSVVLPAATALSGAPGGAAARLPSSSASADPLLPLPGRSPLSLPTVAPDGQTAGFQYPTPGPQVADPATAPKAEKASADPMRWGKSVALALILLIVAAHLGAWTRRLRLAQVAETGPGGAAAAPVRRKKPASNKTERAPAPEPNVAADDDAEAPGSPARSGQAPRTGGGGAGSGRLIDAKGTVVNAPLLGINGAPRRAAAAPADDTSPSGVVRATAGAGAADPAGRARAQHSKAGGSRARRSAGYRGRRRAD